MSTMDVASSKLFRYQHKTGAPSLAPGRVSNQWDKKEKRYQKREYHYRGEALRKGRIIILPFNTINHGPSQLRRTASEGNNAQSVVRATARLRPSFQDIASLNKTQSGTEVLNYDPVHAQRLTQLHQRQSDSEGLYRGYSEDNIERAPSPTLEPKTFWGGRLQMSGQGGPMG